MVTDTSLVTENLALWSSAIEKKSSSGRGGGKKIKLAGIQKLRDLILDLAVRGLLIPQDLSAQPASALIEKIRPETARIASEGKFAEHTSSKVIDVELQPAIPTSWVWCELGEIAAVARGGSPRPIKSFITEEANGLNWIKIGDSVRGSRYITSTDQKIRPEGLVKTRQVYPGDLILSNSMSYGYPYILKISGCIHDGWLVLRLPEMLVDKLYLCNLFLSPYVKRAFTKSASGAVVQNLNADKVKSLVVPLPPLEEQHRIVAKVDELMALCDQLEQQQEASISAHETLVETLLAALTNAADKGEFSQAWERIADNFDTLFTTEHSVEQLKETILQLSCMGKLVSQKKDEQPAIKLVSRVSKIKAELIDKGKLKKQKGLNTINDAEKPFSVPIGWEWCRIGDIAYGTDYGLSDKATEGTNGVPVLAMGNIQNGMVILDTKKVVPKSVSSLPELYLVDRDLLYNRTNSAELVGKTGIYSGADESYTFASYLIRIRLEKGSLLPEFINMNMASRRFRETQIEPHLKQMTGQANVNGTIMKNMLVAIPPEKEMERIISKYAELIGICNSLSSGIRTASAIRTSLADSLVNSASD
ncbi:restriction endonuclease subunit S [Pseudomonadales bacterium]|nr:restriction endonuclease subunit S [Pseudomonadales bacterium]